MTLTDESDVGTRLHFSTRRVYAFVVWTTDLFRLESAQGRWARRQTNEKLGGLGRARRSVVREFPQRFTMSIRDWIRQLENTLK
ncbi:MAG TPA: hypothetical protein VIX91_23885 [Candidatus Acidoferrum sp.]